MSCSEGMSVVPNSGAIVPYSSEESDDERIVDAEESDDDHIVVAEEFDEVISVEGKGLCNRIITRTGCGAMLQIKVDAEGIWKVVVHKVDHNHKMIPENHRHLDRSHRQMPDNDVALLAGMKEHGIGLTHGYKMLHKQGDGSPNLNYTITYARNKLAALERARWECGDANKLLDILRKRKVTEPDFFFDFLHDSSCRLCDDYDCADNKWLWKLHSNRHKWCPTLNKDRFSGGALSSQRSESTNKAICQELSKYTCLCTFYDKFEEVVKGWRKKETHENFRCNIGRVEMKFKDVNLLTHAQYYILGRWRRNANKQCSVVASISNGGSGVVGSTIWRSDVIGKFIRMVSESELSPVAKQLIEEGLSVMARVVEAEVRAIQSRETEEKEEASASNAVVKDPEQVRQIGDFNVRMNNVRLEMNNEARLQARVDLLRLMMERTQQFLRDSSNIRTRRARLNEDFPNRGDPARRAYLRQLRRAERRFLKLQAKMHIIVLPEEHQVVQEAHQVSTVELAVSQ
ncbi:OLC1v1015709C1 [Oldenlandia corymbosa var. corymbosa]|uniref:OLC1v1015709C1 n=1 Tax=Oldenlandia corymbosa var. corymbosa TaxID=529605 RepID=A0AAV1E657_OLDCO|nr:OLC1v1015709C1 [Oldenlandia corymbosa var. corymbosa]